MQPSLGAPGSFGGRRQRRTVSTTAISGLPVAKSTAVLAPGLSRHADNILLNLSRVLISDRNHRELFNLVRLRYQDSSKPVTDRQRVV